MQPRDRLLGLAVFLLLDPGHVAVHRRVLLEIALQAIEQSAGRERPYRNAPRTLDLDILWFGDQVIDTPTLTVPHPRMAERAFVLRPLADLVPERVAAEALQAVTTQSIYPLADGRWAEGVVGGNCS